MINGRFVAIGEFVQTSSRWYLTSKHYSSKSNNQIRRERKHEAAVRAAEAAFTKHFADQQFGYRAASLINALKADSLPSTITNKFCDLAVVQAFLSANGGATPVPGVISLSCFTREGGQRFTPATIDSTGVLSAYHIDAASVLAVQALAPPPDARCLDMCAAPGGKTLALAQLLGPEGSIIANDVSPARRRRLQQVLNSFLPRKGALSGAANGVGTSTGTTWRPPLPPSICVSGLDGTAPCAFGSNMYDRVLLDAPCSSERHVLADEGELIAWGPGCIKSNALRQARLLHTALDAVAEGGVVVYSTCALSRRENDDVVGRVLEKAPWPVAIVPLRFAFGEPTPLGGWHVLPDAANLSTLRGHTGCNVYNYDEAEAADVCHGFGPLYICKLIKGACSIDNIG